MIDEISILLPTYNDVCIDAVRELARQAKSIVGIRWEIIVADDGSTNTDVIKANSVIDKMAQCRYIRRRENVGRSCIRNFLATEARFKWLLFIDSGMGIIRKDFISKYLEAASEEEQVVYGGYEVVGNAQELRNNLRFRYEKANEDTLSVQWRSNHVYDHFHTSNFLISDAVYKRFPLDERVRRYGYEDVLLGKRLATANVRIKHIDNPVAFDVFESNDQFVKKTEESLHTLREFANELRGYSKMLDVEKRIMKWNLARPYLYIYNRSKQRWRSTLCGDSKPSLLLFKVYKLGYFLSLQA